MSLSPAALSEKGLAPTYFSYYKVTYAPGKFLSSPTKLCSYSLINFAPPDNANYNYNISLSRHTSPPRRRRAPPPMLFALPVTLCGSSPPNTPPPGTCTSSRALPTASNHRCTNTPGVMRRRITLHKQMAFVDSFRWPFPLKQSLMSFFLWLDESFTVCVNKFTRNFSASPEPRFTARRYVCAKETYALALKPGSWHSYQNISGGEMN